MKIHLQGVIQGAFLSKSVVNLLNCVSANLTNSSCLTPPAPANTILGD